MAGGVVDEIFNAAAEQAENCLEIKKDWIANPPAWPDHQGSNPMLPNDDNLVHMLDAIWIQSQYACCDAQYACCTIFSAKWTLVLNPYDLEENYPYCICIYCCAI
jgi:hypothetical protein